MKFQEVWFKYRARVSNFSALRGWGGGVEWPGRVFQRTLLPSMWKLCFLLCGKRTSGPSLTITPCSSLSALVSCSHRLHLTGQGMRESSGHLCGMQVSVLKSTSRPAYALERIFRANPGNLVSQRSTSFGVVQWKSAGLSCVRP